MQKIKAFRSKNELVYDALHTAIIRGDLGPGSRLVIDELAASLGVSPIPVREALRQLEGNGLVTIEPHVGAMVTELQATTICEVFKLLGALESISGHAACQCITEDDLNQVEQILRCMNATIDIPDQWSQQNIQFHLSICDCAKTSLVRNAMGKAFDHWDRLRNHYVDGVFLQRIEVAQQEHWEMFEALSSRDADKFVQITHRHNQTALAAYVNYLESKGYITTSGDECS